MAMMCVMALAGVTKVDAEAKEKSQPTEWGSETEGCRLAVMADHEAYRFDQPISLSLVCKNTGGKEIGVTRSTLMRDYRFNVRLPDGKPAPLTLEGKRQAEFPFFMNMLHILKPGDSDTTPVPMLNRLYDMTLRGEYIVTIYRKTRPQGDKQKPVDVMSNVLKIVVHDKDEASSKDAKQQDTPSK